MQTKLNFGIGGMPAILIALTLALAAVALIGCSSTPEPAAPAQSVAPAVQQSAPVQPVATPIPPAAPAPAQPAAPAAMPAAPAPAAQPATASARPTAAPIRRPAATAAPAMTMAEPSEPLSIVTTTSIIADWVNVVGGDRVEVFSMLGAGADPHTYRPGAQDVVRVAEADLIFSMGLHLEASWLEELIHNAAADPERVIALGEGVNPIPFQAEDDDHDDHAGHAHGHADEHDDDEDHDEDHADEHDEDEGHDEDDDHADEHDEDEDHDEDHDEHADEHDEDEDHDDHDDHSDPHAGHDHGALDPHFWFDPLRVKRAVTDISARLATLDLNGAQAYLSSAHAYNAELDALHEWIENEVESIPEDRRLLVTSHDSMAYFANLYHFEVVGAVIPSFTTEVEPSAREIANLIERIREVDAPAIFPETTVSDSLSERVADETDAKIAPPLYSGALGAPGSGADTYLGFMRANVNTIVDALQ